MKVILDTDRNYISFGNITIIQAVDGVTSFDPLNQRETIGVRGRIGDQFLGFWFETEDLRPEEAIYALGQSLMDFAQDPFGFASAQSSTPEGVVYVPADFESVSPAWESGEVPDALSDTLFGTATAEGDEDEIPVAG